MGLLIFFVFIYPNFCIISYKVEHYCPLKMDKVKN